MSHLDPATGSPAALATLRAALVAAQSAPPHTDTTLPDGEEREETDIATPRAKAAATLERVLKARRAWYAERGAQTGEDVCRVLIDMCAWHEHPQLRDRVLTLQAHGLALLEASPASEPSQDDVDDLEEQYLRLKPAADDADAIAAALGLSPEEARAFGLVGTLNTVDIDVMDAEPRAAPQDAEMPSPPDETLEDTFRHEAYRMLTESLPESLRQFWRAQQSMDALLAVRRGFHTLKGDARVTARTVAPEQTAELEGLAVLAEAAEDVIDLLLGEDYDRAQRAPALPAGAFSLLQESADLLARRLVARAPLPEEPEVLQRLIAMQQTAAAIRNGALPQASSAPPAPESRQREAAPTSRSPRHPLLPTFLEEADRLMAELHRSLAVLSQQPANEDALVRARTRLHTLKGSAALAGEPAEDIQQIAHAAEDLFELIEDDQLRGAMTRVPAQVMDGIFDAEEALQARLDELKTELQNERQGFPQLPQAHPEFQELVVKLTTLAAHVRNGELGTADLAAPTASGREETARASLRRAAIGMVGGPNAADQRRAHVPDLTPIDVPVPLAAQSEPSTKATDLHTISFADLLGHATGQETLTGATMAVQARTIELRILDGAPTGTLYTCVQYLSVYLQDLDHYRTLAQSNRRIIVFGKPDAIPPAVEGITLIPLAATDTLSTERVVLVESTQTLVGFVARPDNPTQPTLEPRYRCALLEDPLLLRAALEHLRHALGHDAALIAARQGELARLPQAGATDQRGMPLPAQQELRQRSPLPEYSPQDGVKVALELLEDLSSRRDALQALLSGMMRQSGERRRHTRRLRTLVERVSGELADLRTELVRTSGRVGEWDLLEKEQYTAVDVLLLQLDEALADLEESDNTLRRELGEAHAQMEGQSDNQLRAQRALLAISTVPLAQLEDRLAYAVRTQSRHLQKHVTFALEGGELQIDGTIADSLFDPLMHLINNAIDHGIEATAAERVAKGKSPEGHVVVRGRAVGDGVRIEVSDDGRGIDTTTLAAVAVARGLITQEEAATMPAEQRLALIWRPGFSTATMLSQVSGRGIGLKSVQEDIRALQGRVDVHSMVDAGTTFSLQLPRSLAMVRVEVVREGPDLVAVPIAQLVATHAVPYRMLAQGRGSEPVKATLAGQDLSISPVHLANGPAGDGEAEHGMLLEIRDRADGILVDEVQGSQYLAVRPVAPYLRQTCALLGYAFGGGGRIIPIIDPSLLLDRATHGAVRPIAPPLERRQTTVLVVDDSPTMRRALSDILTRAGFRVRTAADGREALMACASNMPGLITLDMEMPGMDGLEALAALRMAPNGAQVPVLMITSRQQARHRAAALAAGVTRYFTKPYDTDALIQTVRALTVSTSSCAEEPVVS